MGEILYLLLISYLVFFKIVLLFFIHFVKSNIVIYSLSNFRIFPPLVVKFITLNLKCLLNRYLGQVEVYLFIDFTFIHPGDK